MEHVVYSLCRLKHRAAKNRTKRVKAGISSDKLESIQNDNLDRHHSKDSGFTAEL